jgi:hypothetical protein
MIFERYKNLGWTPSIYGFDLKQKQSQPGMVDKSEESLCFSQPEAPGESLKYQNHQRVMEQI